LFKPSRFEIMPRMAFKIIITSDLAHSKHTEQEINDRE
jgi:hypothetical protein